jgi:Uncharacterized conserved protein
MNLKIISLPDLYHDHCLPHKKYKTNRIPLLIDKRPLSLYNFTQPLTYFICPLLSTHHGQETSMTDTQKFNRREVISKGLSLGLIAGGAVILGKPDFLLAKEKPADIPDLVAVKNGEPDTMFKKAIELMGGMGQFVKKGQTVVIKPNMCGPYKPELAATTNPILVKTICEYCYQSGAKKVYVFDNVSQPVMANKCYQIPGIEAAAKAAGAVMVTSDKASYYKEVKIPDASNILEKARVHEIVLKSDVFINVPILKHHSYTHLTIAMKNLMGVIYDRMEYHNRGVDKCIADFCLFRKPDLNIVDAYRVLMRGGPSPPSSEKSPDIKLKKTLLMSRDIVAVDAAAAKIFGIDPADVRHIEYAHELKIGNMNLKELKIVTYAM